MKVVRAYRAYEKKGVVVNMKMRLAVSIECVLRLWNNASTIISRNRRVLQYVIREGGGHINKTGSLGQCVVNLYKCLWVGKSTMTNGY